MKSKHIFWIYSLVIMGVFLILINSCKKDDNKATNPTTPTVKVPVLTSSVVVDITKTSATCGGNITSDGGAIITERGVCWSTGSTPTITNNKTSDGTGTGSFTSNLSGLQPGTTYYVRAYAINSSGTGYGSVISFTTSNSGITFNPNLTYGSITDIDGNIYKTIQIGTQKWMAENLKTTKYNDGTAIPFVSDEAAWAALSTPGYCWYNNDAATYKATYGALYNWYTVKTVMLCPTGWHAPSDVEWTTLTTYLGGESVAGGKLKESGTAHWLSPNTGATNESGFTALPGGTRLSSGAIYPVGTYGYIGTWGFWWSSTEYNTDRAFGSQNGNNSSSVMDKQEGISVRCVQGADVPAMTTIGISSITDKTANSGGNILSDGGATVTTRGVCWSTTSNPTVANSKTVDGTGTGAFTSSITGLSPGTNYYVRAYATNNVGTNYGNLLSFTTNNLPTLTTTAASSIIGTTATSGGTITSDGGATVTARGVCWNTTSNPTVANSKTVDGTGTGSFTSSITGLTANTTYYVRAYATNSVGTAYGNILIIKTYSGNVTDINGNVYNTVIIGTQVWMAENLKTVNYNNYIAIPFVTDGDYWYLWQSPGYCWYNNDAATNKATYGALYNWYAVNTGKLCPTGWHVPTDADWTTLTTYLGGVNVAGGKLKETGTTHWLSPNTGATNESLFTALPGGLRGNWGSYLNIRYGGFWWSSTESSTGNAGNAWSRQMHYDDSYVDRSYFGKDDGFSVRCLRDY